MNLLKRFSTAILSVLLMGIVTPASAQSYDELYAAARKEGALSSRFYYEPGRHYLCEGYKK